MAIPFVQSITMSDFQILNFVVHSSGTAPTNASGAGGMMWWDSTNRDLKVYNDSDTAWNSLVQGPATTTNAYVPQWSGTIGNKLSTGLQVKTTVGATGDDLSLVTEQGIREAITSAVTGGVTYQGGYDASLDSPSLDDGTPIAGILQGDMYVVTVAGNFFTDAVAIGDILIALQDSPTLLSHWTVVAREWDETFLELGDTPASFSGAGSDFLRVNAGATAVEFVDATAINLSSFNNNLASLTTGTNPGLTMSGSYNGSAARTIVMTISNLASGIIGTGDFIPFHDISGGSTVRTTIDSLITYIESNITTIVGNTTNALVQSPGAGQDGYAIVWDNTAGEYTLDTFASGATSFVGLTDTPSAYTGAANYLVRVNATPNALEFIAPSTLSLSDFTNDLANLSAESQGGISFSGSYNGSVARTIALSITSLPSGTLQTSDQLAIFDVSGADHVRITIDDIVTFTETELDTDGYAKVLSGDVPLGAAPVITHSLGLTEPTDIAVQIWRQSDNKQVGVELTAAINSVTVNFGDAAINPALGTFRYVIFYNVNA